MEVIVELNDRCTVDHDVVQADSNDHLNLVRSRVKIITSSLLTATLILNVNRFVQF